MKTSSTSWNMYGIIISYESIQVALSDFSSRHASKVLATTFFSIGGVGGHHLFTS